MKPTTGACWIACVVAEFCAKKAPEPDVPEPMAKGPCVATAADMGTGAETADTNALERFVDG